MFEPRMNAIERVLRHLWWELSAQHVMRLRERVLFAAAFLALGALLTLAAISWYAHANPAEVLATDARLEDHSERYLVYSLGVEHWGVEVRCLLAVDRIKSADRQDAAFTVSC